MSHSDLAFYSRVRRGQQSFPLTSSIAAFTLASSHSLFFCWCQQLIVPLHTFHYFSVEAANSAECVSSGGVQAECVRVWVWVGCETRRDKVARVCVKEAIADVRSNHTRLWKIHVHTKTKLLTWNKERQMSHPMQNQLHRLVLDGWLTGWYVPPSPALLLSQEQIKVEPTDNTEG